ncbi:type II secretion system F family protein [Allosalinactinospora lopnorensis]|uniref:type II secretion system F family protein n=1 Tax=Allosalinactinospora lopnorensis TaxID=1352348 RepID=UPI0009E27C7C|nr:type II secretion system F family protein [Allosalinactinospora lopnorensis]
MTGLIDGEVWISGLAGWLLALGSGGWVLTRSLPSAPTVRLRSALPPSDTRSRHSADGSPASKTEAPLRHRWDSALGRVRNRRRQAVVDLCRVLAAELRAGRAPAEAMRSALTELDPAVVAELAYVAAAAQAGDDPAPALRGAAARPGAEGLGYLAACWQVASGTGSGLADVVDRLAESLAHDEAHRQEVVAQLAGPRTTALLLSLLPALGLAMATAMGTGPLLFLFTTPAGLACLLLGLVLDALGLWWTHRMVGGVLVTVDPGRQKTAALRAPHRHTPRKETA